MRLLLRAEQRLYTALRTRAERKLARRAAATGQRPQAPHLLTGEHGEDAAYFHLRSLGYTVVARRWRSERLASDLDLVAWDGDMLVIFEVKTRTARDLYPAEIQVDPEKRRLLRGMAAHYLHQLPREFRRAVKVRFDILSVYLLPTGVEFHHIPNAFPRTPPPRRRA